MKTRTLYFSLLTGFFLVACIIGLVLVNKHARPEPDAAIRGGDVVPAAEFANVNKSEEYYLEQITRYPDVVHSYSRLAQLRMQQARTTGDEARYVSAAHDLIREALSRDPDDYPSRVLYASILNSLHRFEDALEEVTDLMQLYPRHSYNLGTAVDALVELGRYDEAVEMADSMLALRPGLPAYARASYLRELHGDLDGAVEAMIMAANAGAIGTTERAWALDILGGLLLQINEIDKAEEVYEAILVESPEYAHAVAGLARVSLARNMPAEALRIVRDVQGSENHMEYLELETEIQTLLGSEDRVDVLSRMIEDKYLRLEKAGEIIDMEYADFLADQETELDEALQRILREYDRRPTHLHVNETYAWVLHKLGRSDEAVPYIEKAMHLETVDPMVWFRAAQIYAATGQMDKAIAMARAAIKNHLAVESRSAMIAAEDLLEDWSHD